MRRLFLFLPRFTVANLLLFRFKKLGTLGVSGSTIFERSFTRTGSLNRGGRGGVGGTGFARGFCTSENILIEGRDVILPVVIL